jgi:hypothetical protein
VVKCPEFRQLLLLLREDLKDTDIPHRTKIREQIIKAWKIYFQELKDDVVVCYILLMTQIIAYDLVDGCGQDQFYI